MISVAQDRAVWFRRNHGAALEDYFTLRAFKRSFGTESRPSPVVIRRDWRLSIIDAVAGRLKG